MQGRIQHEFCAGQAGQDICWKADMTRMFELSDDLYDELSEAAESVGSTPADWIATEARRARSHEPPGEQDPGHQGTLADLFKGHIGGFRNGRDKDLSLDCGEKFTDYLEEKRKAGHL